MEILLYFIHKPEDPVLVTPSLSFNDHAFCVPDALSWCAALLVFRSGAFLRAFQT